MPIVDNYGNQVAAPAYPGSIDGGAIDAEYTPDPERIVTSYDLRTSGERIEELERALTGALKAIESLVEVAQMNIERRTELELRVEALEARAQRNEGDL